MQKSSNKIKNRNHNNLPEMLTIALAGNANVGKSAIFNQLIGVRQETGNWPGKTIEAAEGILVHHGRKIRIVDLPGIYSFSTYSPEEMITRKFILTRHPEIVINVIDATALERNLYFTLQLAEMGIPFVIALNFADVAAKKHIHIDADELRKVFGVPVVNTVAIKGIGIHEMVDLAINLADKNQIIRPSDIKYGREIEERLSSLIEALKSTGLEMPHRWVAIKLLEDDQEIVQEITRSHPEIAQLSQALAGEIAKMHGEDAPAVIVSERYAMSARISRQVRKAESQFIPTLAQKIDNLSLHPITGYIVLFVLLLSILVIISFFGGWVSEIIPRFFNLFKPELSSPLISIVWEGGVVGLYASLSVALGFIFPFYLILGALAECGYLPRIAFLMDRPCHTLGLHGQASLPLLLALGCNVPACLSCRIMENRRDRLIAIFLTTLVPCSARTSVILGLVGAFVGIYWAIGIFAFQFLLIALIGRILNRLMPSSSPGIIMEIPEYRIPSPGIIFQQAWKKFKDFLIIGVPLIVAGSAIIETLRVFNYMDMITRFISPLTVTWLGLPAFTGVLLIFGILRKEAALALLITFSGGSAITDVMSPLQMVVFSLVIMLYIPCISTIAVLIRETGLKATIVMVITEILMAIAIGGIASRLLDLIL